VGFLPFGIAGFLLKDIVEELLKSVTVVAVMLILGGIVLLFIDKFFNNKPESDSTPTFKQAFLIGMFQ
jgi:undecaprenyl-diphosphatase